ncbi:MAG: hypothetical protein ACYTG0_05380 [Planctomycetota bacterium]
MTVQFELPEGELNRITFLDVPMIECAIVGRLKNPNERFDLLPKLWGAFLAGCLETPPGTITEQADLGLGVETFTFRGDFWDQVPGNVKVAAEEDLVPHYFIQDGWLVFSPASSSLASTRSWEA